MGEVIESGIPTKGEIPPDKILMAQVGYLDELLLIGIDKNGEFVVATSNPDIPRAVYLAQKFIHKELNGDYE